MNTLMAPPPESVGFSVDNLERVFRESHAAVFRAAYRVTGNASDAEDALQTVFLRLLKRDAAADAVENMPSFLGRAAVNAALDIVRSRQGIRNIPLDELEPVLAEPAHRRPDRLQASSEIRDWLRGALARLNPVSTSGPMLRRTEVSQLSFDVLLQIFAVPYSLLRSAKKRSNC